MTAIEILNVVRAVFVVTASLSLLRWGIVTDRAWPATWPFRGRGARGRRRAPRPGALCWRSAEWRPQRGRR